MKQKWLAILKVAAIGAGGAVVAQPDLIGALIPVQYAPYFGAGISLLGLFLKRPQTAFKPPLEPQLTNPLK